MSICLEITGSSVAVDSGDGIDVELGVGDENCGVSVSVAVIVAVGSTTSVEVLLVDICSRVGAVPVLQPKHTVVNTIDIPNLYLSVRRTLAPSPPGTGS